MRAVRCRARARARARARVRSRRRAPPGTRRSPPTTHLQPAQPVLLAHLWLAHVAALERDEERFLAAREAADRLAARRRRRRRQRRCATTARRSRRGSGSAGSPTNSIDAVGDRDFALEYLNAAAALGIHLSRLAEDLVLACSPASAGYVGTRRFLDRLEPAAAEAQSRRLRARARQVRPPAHQRPAPRHRAQGAAVLVPEGSSGGQGGGVRHRRHHGAPVRRARSRDRSVAPEPRAHERDRSRPICLAVELADALVEHGVPFREAHAQVGVLWAAAESAGVTPRALAEPDRLALSPHFTDATLDALTVESALARRDHAPGGGASSVMAQLEAARRSVGECPPRSLAGRIPWTTRQRTPFGRARPWSPWLPSPSIVLRRATLDDVPGIAARHGRLRVAGRSAAAPGERAVPVRPRVPRRRAARRERRRAADRRVRRAARVVGRISAKCARSPCGPITTARASASGSSRAVLDDARSLALPRVIALTREVPFFERCGFTVASRDTMPRKVWTDCVRCPRRHACDEVAVVLDLVPGASRRRPPPGARGRCPFPSPS